MIRFSLLAFFLAPILSCASLSPLAVPPEDFPLRAAKPGDLAPRWEALVPGIGYLEARVGKPRLQLWALRVELDNPEVEVVVNRGSRGIIPGTTVSGFVRDYGCVAGINANPFDRITRRAGEPLTVVGIAMTEGSLVAAPDPRYDALVLYRDGSAAILSQADLDEAALAGVRNAVGGFRVTLRDGAIAERLLNRTGKGPPPRHPRSAAGLSADGRILYLLAVDGRRLGSVGATEREIAIILQRLGADDGLNLDGGGSTTLALRYGDGNIRPANTPVSGKERNVAACLGLRSGNAGP
jgi:exopolysaccharide biosynthesis protein